MLILISPFVSIWFVYGNPCEPYKALTLETLSHFDHRHRARQDIFFCLYSAAPFAIRYMHVRTFERETSAIYQIDINKNFIIRKNSL